MLVIYNIGTLVTVSGDNSLRTGSVMNNINVIKNGFLVIKDGRFIEIGKNDAYLKYKQATLIDAEGKLVTPGLIDAHTHLVHKGSREDEFILKLKGVSYLDILKQGGGILNTVTKTRAASFDELMIQAEKSLNIMIKHGVTTVEAKSGYGLELLSELKQLEVVKVLNQKHPIHLVSTFMGAHAIPNEYIHKRDEYIVLLKQMLVKIKDASLASFCDIFCEEGVFSLEETEDILRFAKKLGYMLKMHADEMTALGGARLASKLKCHSAEHLIVSELDDLKALADAKVVAVLLPLTSFFLNKPFANARAIIDFGGGIAIATDYNPGSSPSENLQLAMQIAALKMKLTPEEIITAVTINGAVSLGLEQTKGSIEVGKDADFVIFDCPNLDYLFYHFGINHVQDVYIKGKKVVSNQIIMEEKNEIY